MSGLISKIGPLINIHRRFTNNIRLNYINVEELTDKLEGDLDPVNLIERESRK